MAHKTKVRLEVLDSESNLITKLVDEVKEAGTYEIEFILSIFHSIEEACSYRLKAGDYLSEKKMIIIK